MLFPLLISIVLLGSAVLTRFLASRPGLAIGAAWVSLSIGILLLVGAFARAPDAGESFWLNDQAARATGTVALSVALIGLLIDPSPAVASAGFWSAALLVFSSSNRCPVLLWAAMQFSILPLFFYGRAREDGLRSLLFGHRRLLIGSLLFGFGALLRDLIPGTGVANSIGWILGICGLGGMLGWFPFPRATDGPKELTLTDVLVRRLLPALTAAVYLFRRAEDAPLADQQQFLLVVGALFPLTLCSVRLLSEERLSRRLTLSSLSTLSFLALAVCLMSWEGTHPERGWSVSSNFPDGKELFISILVCETFGLLALTSGFCMIVPSLEEGNYAQTLAGSPQRLPGSSVPLLAGLGSLAGVPPLPGFWWRFALVAAFSLPRRRSMLTRVIETETSFTLLSCAVIVLILLNSLGQLRLGQGLLLEEPFRIRTLPVRRRLQAAGVLSVALLLAVTLAPLSLWTKRETPIAPAPPLPINSEVEEPS